MPAGNSYTAFIMPMTEERRKTVLRRTALNIAKEKRKRIQKETNEDDADALADELIGLKVEEDDACLEITSFEPEQHWSRLESDDFSQVAKNGLKSCRSGKDQLTELENLMQEKNINASKT